MDRITGVLNILTLGKEYVLFDSNIRDYKAVSSFKGKLKALGLFKDVPEEFIFLHEFAAKTNTVYHRSCEMCRAYGTNQLLEAFAGNDSYRRIRFSWIAGSHYFRATVLQKAAFTNKYKGLKVYYVFPCAEDWLGKGILECKDLDAGLKPWYYCITDDCRICIEKAAAGTALASSHIAPRKEKEYNKNVDETDDGGFKLPSQQIL